MAYKQRQTANRVALITLQRLPPQLLAQCERLRAEAGRLWSDLVTWHATLRAAGAGGLDDATIRARTKGGQYALHSQSIQALGQQFLANLASARALRADQRAAGQPPTANDPYRPSAYQTITWKGQAIARHQTSLILPNGRGQPDLQLRVPRRFVRRTIVQVELLWRADHYQLALTLEEPAPLAARVDVPALAGVDLGEVNAAAVVTEAGTALVVSGRKLRAMKRQRNKTHGAIQQRLARCRPGSRRSRRLLKRKAQCSARLYRQQRDVLHQVARQIIRFAVQHGITLVAIGDVRRIQDGVDLGARSNQKIAQWPHGQLQHYLEEKAERAGIGTTLIDEAYTTRTCAQCGYEHAQAPRGRRMRCAGCGAETNRDANGAANIAARCRDGRLATIAVRSITYRRPVRHRRRRDGVVQPTPATRSLAPGVAAPALVG